MLKVISVVLSLVLTVSESSSLDMLARMFGAFTGGSSQQKMPDRDYNLCSISFSSSKNSNDGIATQLHLVLIYDDQLAEDLSQRSAKEYFSMVDQLKHDYRGKIAILEWEIPSENRISKPYSLKKLVGRAKPKLILIFANMRSKKLKHRYPIAENDRRLHIVVGKDKLIFGGSARNSSRNNSNYKDNNFSPNSYGTNGIRSRGGGNSIIGTIGNVVGRLGGMNSSTGQNGYNQSYNSGYNQNGYSQGYNSGYNQNGYNQGYNSGYNQNGYNQDYNSGYNQNGYNQGYNSGYNQNGYNQGYSSGYNQNGYSQGYNSGYNQNGYNRGYNSGYSQEYNTD